MTDRPIFERVDVFGSDPADQTITIGFGQANDAGTLIDLKIGAVGRLMGLLAAEVQKLNPQLSEGDQMTTIPISADAVWITKSESGGNLLVFELTGGALLSLQLESADISGLAAEMSLIAMRTDRPN